MDKQAKEEANKTTPRVARRLWPTWSERRKLLLRQAWYFVLSMYVLLVFSYAWSADLRSTSHPVVGIAWVAFMVRTFTFHAGCAVLLMAFVAAGRRHWRLLLTTLPVLAITLGPEIWEYRPRYSPAINGERATVMTVNLLRLNSDTRPIIEEIREARPDVLLLQEYTDHWHDALQSSIGPDYPYVAYRIRTDSFGAAIYSTLPFSAPVEMEIGLGWSTLPQIRSEVQFGRRRLAIYNVHLLPPGNLDNTIEQRHQFADLVDKLKAEQLPFIVAGDFNFTQRSLLAGALRKANIQDAQTLGGWGRGATWPVHSLYRWVPGIRLDHIYLGPGLTCSTCRTGMGLGSDHRPVIAEIGFAQ